MASFTELDKLLEQFVKSGKGPAGCGCAVAQNGKILYEGYHGLADIESNRPITEDSIYRLYSMTKVVICTAAMMLFERGKFLLNDPLYEYFPEWREHTILSSGPDGYARYEKSKGPMLVKHAFSMAVGLPYHFGDHPVAREIGKVKAELKEKHGRYNLQTEIKAMAKVPIAFEPGTHFLYGYGHELVAGLIEVCSGKTVGEFLQQEIFEPLGMKNTAYRYFGDIRERMVSFYEKGEDGSMTKAPGLLDDDHEPEAKFEAGGAGLFSTVKEYLTFTQMLACGGVYNGQQIIGRKTIDLMRQNQMNEQQLKDFDNPYNAGYGYGLGVRTMMDLAKGNANTSIGEFGWTGGAGTWTAIDPAEGVSVAYMHQLSPNLELYHHLRVRAAAFGGLR